MKQINLSAPVMLLAAVGLVVASAAGGYAGGQIGGGDIRNGSIGSADLRNNSVSSHDLQDAGIKPGDLNPSLLQTASVGKAYAFVTRVETSPETVVHKLDKTRSSGFKSLYQATDDGEPITGTWCLVPSKGVDLSHSAIQTSTDYAQSAGVAVDALWSSTSFYCKAEEVEIETVQWGSDDEPSPSDNVAFQVFAP